MTLVLPDKRVSSCLFQCFFRRCQLQVAWTTIIEDTRLIHPNKKAAFKILQHKYFHQREVFAHAVK